MRNALLLALVLAACHSPHPEALPGPKPGPPGRIVGTVPMRGTDVRKTPKVYLQRLPDGPVETQRASEDGTFAFGPLEPGRYLIAVEEPTARNGPVAFHHAEVEVTATDGVRVDFELPRNPARMRIRAAKHTPPFLLALIRADAAIPTDTKSIGALLEERPMPNPAVIFRITDDGHGPFEVPPLPPGEYQILTVAIDWEDGDPPVQPRVWPLELPPGKTRTVTLRKRLVELEIR